MAGRAAVTTTLTLAAALIAAVACQQVLSIDGKVTVAARSACGLPVPAGSCQACVESSCCAEATACAAEPDCKAFEGCMLACGSDYACRTECNVTHLPGATPTVPAFDRCATTVCNDACGTTCGLSASPSAPDAAAVCSQCITGRVCSQVEACAKSLECETMVRCVAGCRTVDCHDTCLANRDGGAFTAVEVGLITSCLTQCQLGNLWECVGGVTWPTPPAGASDVDFSIIESGTSAAVPDPIVKACSKLDVSCSGPVASVTGDVQGRGTLSLPPNPAIGLGFDGYFDIDGTANGYVHWLVFSSSPLTQARPAFTWSVLKQADLTTLLQSVQLTPTPALGYVLAAVADCLIANSSDVVVTATTGTGMDLSAQRYYLAGGALSKTAKVTDITGYVFFLGVPPGSLTVTATPKALGRPSSTQVIFARADTFSSVILLPTPQ